MNNFLLDYINDIKNTIITENEKVNHSINMNKEEIKTLLPKYNINNIYKEIEFFDNNNENINNTIFSLLSKNLSLTSKNNLKHLLNNYIDNIEELKIRQQFINFMDRLDIDISYIIEYENNYYWFINPYNYQLEEFKETIYFKNLFNFIDISKINNSDKFLDYYYNFLMIISPLWGIFNPLIYILGPFIFSKYILKFTPNITFKQYINSVKDTLFKNNIFKTVLIGVNFLLMTTMVITGGNNEKQSFFKKFYDKVKIGFLKLLKYILSSDYTNYAYLLFIVIGYLWTLFNSYIMTKNYYNIVKFIYHRVKDIHILLNKVKELVEIINKHLLPNFFNIDQIKLILSKSISIELTNSEIQDKFINEYNLLSNKGLYLSFFNKINNELTNDDIINLLNFISYIEIFKSLSKSIKNYNFSKVLLLTKNKPELTVYKLNYPSIQNYEKNNINLYNSANDNLNLDDKIEKHNIEGRQNLILTGPNGSGKSTFLKSLMSSIILAQTIGYTTAEFMSLTPFNYLSTYLNIPDCIGKESLFQAEMNRCHKHLKHLEKLEKENKFSLNIMDEIFVSTNYYEGMSGAWAILKKLTKYNNSINIITTHFDKCLEIPINEYIYKHFTITNDNIKNYKLLNGINKKHCAISLLEKYGFDKDIIDDAKNKYNEVKDIETE